MVSLAHLAERGWIGRQFSPITALWATTLTFPDPRWSVYSADLARAPMHTYWSPMYFSAAGASIDPREALGRTLGEAIERHASMHAIDQAVEVQVPFARSALAHRFPRCAPDEPCPPMFRGHHWDRPSPHVEMTLAATGEQVHVPTAYVHLGAPLDQPDTLATYPISTGIAFSEDRVQACWRGLCEVAERDAIMLWWWSRAGARRLSMEAGSLPLSLRSRIDRIHEASLSCTLFDISTDFPVPVVLAIVTSSTFPYTTVGASCQADLTRAACKALDEAISVRASLHHDRWNRPIPSFLSFDWVQRLEDHMALYGAWQASPAFAFLDTVPSEPLSTAHGRYDVSVPSTNHDFVTFCRRLHEELDFSVLVAELTCDDTADLGHVVRVVVPEMVPLSQDHHARWLATPRLTRWLDAHGAEINPYPHPFA